MKADTGSITSALHTCLNITQVFLPTQIRTLVWADRTHIKYNNNKHTIKFPQNSLFSKKIVSDIANPFCSEFLTPDFKNVEKNMHKYMKEIKKKHL